MSLISSYYLPQSNKDRPWLFHSALIICLGFLVRLRASLETEAQAAIEVFQEISKRDPQAQSYHGAIQALIEAIRNKQERDSRQEHELRREHLNQIFGLVSEVPCGPIPQGDDALPSSIPNLASESLNEPVSLSWNDLELNDFDAILTTSGPCDHEQQIFGGLTSSPGGSYFFA